MIWHIWQALLSWIGIATSAEMERCAGRLAEVLGKIAMIESAQQNIIKILHEAEDERDKALARLGSLVDTMEHLGGRVIAAENRGDLLHARMCDAEARLANPTVTVSYPPDKPIMLPADSAKDAAIKEAIRESLKNTRGHAVEMYPSPARGFVTNRELNSYIKDLKNQQETSKVSYRGQEIDEKGSLSVDLKVKASEGPPEIESLTGPEVVFHKKGFRYAVGLNLDDSRNIRIVANPYFVDGRRGYVKGLFVTGLGRFEGVIYKNRNCYIGFNEFGSDGSGHRAPISEAAYYAIRDALKFLDQA